VLVISAGSQRHLLAMRQEEPVDQDVAFGRWFSASRIGTQAVLAAYAVAATGANAAQLGQSLIQPAALLVSPFAALICALAARAATGHPTAARLPTSGEAVRGDPSRGPFLRRVVLRLKILIHRFRPVKTIVSGLVLLASAWLLALYVTVCFGAPAFSVHYETGAFAAIMVALAVFPSVLVYGPEDRDSLLRVFFVSDLYESDPLAFALFLSASFSVAGAWFGAFPIPLDWDRDWQEWPITCCLGAYGGHFLGELAALASLEMKSRRRRGLSLARTGRKKRA